MNSSAALDLLRAKIRLKHLAYSTEQAYAGWLVRYMRFLVARKPAGSTEKKIESYLTHLARDQDVSAVTQNQAFNALLFFHVQCLELKLGEIRSLRAKRRQHERISPSREQVADLRRVIIDTPNTPAKLLVDLLYGCGLRVSEPLELRVRDVLLAESQLVIRDAKGGKDRRVPIPCACAAALRMQMDRAHQVWEWDRANAAQVPVSLPHQLAKKYPRAGLAWQWFWVFPAPGHCDHPRTGQRVRYHLLHDSLQRVVLTAARKVGLEGLVTAHCLRHAYATHQLGAGEDIKTIQAVMGHVSLETTAGYLHADVRRASNPLDRLKEGVTPFPAAAGPVFVPPSCNQKAGK